MNRTVIIPSSVVLPRVTRIGMLLESLDLPIPDNQIQICIYNAMAEIYYHWITGVRSQDIDTYIDTYLMGEHYPLERRRDLITYIAEQIVALYNEIYGTLNAVMSDIYMMGDDLEQIYFCFPDIRSSVVMVLESSPDESVMHHPRQPDAQGSGGYNLSGRPYAQAIGGTTQGALTWPSHPIH